MKIQLYYIYIMASMSGTLYIGVTNNIFRRVWEHKIKLIDGFTKKYGCTRLIYYEEYRNINDAIAREKELKKWNRNKKEILIASKNPAWVDLLPDPTLER